MQHPLAPQITDKFAAAAQKAQVFDALNRTADVRMVSASAVSICCAKCRRLRVSNASCVASDELHTALVARTTRLRWRPPLDHCLIRVCRSDRQCLRNPNRTARRLPDLTTQISRRSAARRCGSGLAKVFHDPRQGI
jgi:hypothetical protein